MNRKNTDMEYSMDDVRYDPVAAYQLACALERKNKSPHLVQSLLIRSVNGAYNPARLKLAGRLIRGYYLSDGAQCSSATTKSEARGVRLIREAADANSCIANYLLGRAYLSGIGVKADKVKADSFLNHITEATYDADRFETEELMIFGSISHELRNMLVKKLDRSRNSRAQ